MNRLFALTFLLLSGCNDWPDPVIRSITPAQMVASTSTRVEIQTDLPLATTVDYGRGSAEPDLRATVFIGDVELNDGTAPIDGLFVVDVPTLFDPGTYPVSVVLGDERSVVQEDAFTVEPGAWPDTYTIDTIGTQTRFVSFTITVRAQGANAATFSGNVKLLAPASASIGPPVSGKFENGVLVQTVVINTPLSSDIVIVEDMVGHRVSSNSFTVQ